MKEPQKIPIDSNSPKSKAVNMFPLPRISHLYDDFGYLLSIEKKDNYTIESHKDDTFIPSDLNKSNNENSKNSN